MIQAGFPLSFFMQFAENVEKAMNQAKGDYLTPELEEWLSWKAAKRVQEEIKKDLQHYNSLCK